MKTTLYDAGILQQQADRLYDQARWIAIKLAAVYAVITFLACTAISIISKVDDQQTGSLVLIATVVAAVIGGVWGYEKSFKLRLEAQTILCQRQIEINTRDAAQEREASEARRAEFLTSSSVVNQ